MRVIICPSCGRENRPSVRAATCDDCGEDISVEAFVAVPAVMVAPPAVDHSPAFEDSAPGAGAAPLKPPTEQPTAARGEQKAPVDLAGRVFLTGVALSVGLLAGALVPAGNALSLDPYALGSVAILGVATGIAGVVLLLVGSGAKGAQHVPLGLRVVGFLLAALGVLATGVLLRVDTGKLVPVPQYPTAIEGPRVPMPSGGMPGMMGPGPMGSGMPGWEGGRPPGAPTPGPGGAPGAPAPGAQKAAPRPDG